jgi:chromosome segregation ATPase
VIIGIPVVMTVGLKLYDLHAQALESQMKALEAQNEQLKLTQFDRSLTMMKAQKEIYDVERASLEKKIDVLSASGADKSAEIEKLQAKLVAIDSSSDQLTQMMKHLAVTLKQTAGKDANVVTLTLERQEPPPPPADAKQTRSEDQSRK